MDLFLEQLFPVYLLKVALGFFLAGLVFVIVIAVHYAIRLKRSPQAPYAINRELAGSFRQVACGKVGAKNPDKWNASHHIKEGLVMIEGVDGFTVAERANLSEESVNKILLRSEF